MLYQDLLLVWRETALSILLRDSDTPKHPKECYLKPPCGCSNPGKEVQCEDCPHLEACLSRFKSMSSSATTATRKSKVKSMPLSEAKGQKSKVL